MCGDTMELVFRDNNINKKQGKIKGNKKQKES